MTSARAGACAALLAALLLIGAGDAFSATTATSGSVTIEIVGMGKVTGPGINCGSGTLACFAAFNDATLVSLKATNPGGWTFQRWEDGCSGVTNPCSVPTAAGTNTTVTAIFAPNSTIVDTGTLNVGVAGNGTVSNGSTELAVNCGTGGTTCTLTTSRYSTVTVLPTPDAGELFAGWGGSCSGPTRTYCSVYLNPNASISGAFADSTTNTLSVSVDAGGSVTGGGISCGPGTNCSVEEPPTATITLTATAQSGFAFTGWSGDCTGLQATCTVQMSSDRDVTANFDPLVPVVISVVGNGKVTGAGVTCGPGPATCQGNAPPGTSVLLTGTPASGSGVTWSGCTSVAGNVCRISVSTTPVAVTATFSGGTAPPSTFTLSLSVTGNGYVTSSNGSIYCTSAAGAGCTATLTQGTSITLTAVQATASATNSGFLGWGGECSASTTTTCTVTMSSAKFAEADFNGVDDTFLLSAQVQGTGSGTISGAGLKCVSSGGTGCSAQQAVNATVTLTATPNSGSTFTGWGGACTGTSSNCQVAMSAAKTVTASFASSGSKSGSATLTLTVAGGGTVKWSSAPDCVAPLGQTRVCTHEYAANSQVTLAATPANGLAFSGWKGACTGTKPACTLTLKASTAVTATFAKVILAASHKPTVAKVSGGYRVHLFYLAAQAGTLKLSVTRSGAHVATHSKQVAAGKGSLLVPLKRKGRYVFTLTLTAKTGAQTIHWVVRI